jgi:hypothetical protein
MQDWDLAPHTTPTMSAFSTRRDRADVGSGGRSVVAAVAC